VFRDKSDSCLETIEESHFGQGRIGVFGVGLRVHFAYALLAVRQVFHLEKKQHLVGLVRVLPQVLKVHALLRMVGRIALQLLFDGGQWCAREFCEYVCHGGAPVEASIIAAWPRHGGGKVFDSRPWQMHRCWFYAAASPPLLSVHELLCLEEACGVIVRTRTIALFYEELFSADAMAKKK
jgi:hypothetical protein